MLIIIDVTFFIYNCLPEGGRILLYPVLQISKYVPPTFVFTVNPIGLIVAAAQVTAMSFGYIHYRMTGTRANVNRELIRLISAVVIIAAVFTFDLYSAWPFDVVASSFAVCWCVVRLAKRIAMIQVKKYWIG